MHLKEAKEELERWDLKGEVHSLSVEEVVARRECMANVCRLSHMNCSILWQKARVRWLKNGDANSRYFHGCINMRRRKNEILCLNIEGVRVEGVEQLKSAIIGNFSNHF